MPEPKSELTTVIGFTWRRIHTFGAIAFAILGLAAGGGAQIALSKAELDSHATRIVAVEASAGLAARAVLDLAKETAVHNAARDQQQDSIKEAVARIEDKLDSLSDRVDEHPVRYRTRYRTVYAPANSSPAAPAKK